MADKFNNELPLFFKQHSICRTIDLSVDFNLFTFPFACLLIILFTIITKRSAFLKRKYCQGYVGIPIPLDFFSHVKRTLIAVIFALLADELLSIAQQVIFNKRPASTRGLLLNQHIEIDLFFF